VSNSDFSSVSEALELCDASFYPHVNKLLMILVTLPVSAERSFSVVRRLKTWLRTNMSQDRLVGLDLRRMHRDINVTTQQVLERFVKMKRRVDFVL